MKYPRVGKLLTSLLSTIAIYSAATVATNAAQMDFVGAVSPAKDRIIYYSYRGGNPDIFIADLDGRNEKNLTNSPDYWDIEPVWSPDGKKIYFSRGKAMPNLNIYALDIESLQLEQVTDSEKSDSGVSVSPDGKHIAYNRQWDEFKRGSIFIKSLETQKEELVIESQSEGQVALKPRWNKNGDGFLYTFSESGGLATHDLYFYDLAESKSDLIYQTPGRVRMPNWAYQGNRILFSSNYDGVLVSKDNYFKVYLFDLNTKSLTALTSSKKQDEFFSFHVEGSDEVFIDSGTWRDGFKIHRVNLMTKKQAQITQN